MAHLPQEMLSAYLDGELPADQAAAARQHLGACVSCSAEIAAFRSLDDALLATPDLSCAAAAPLISGHFDGEADSPETLAAAAHLASCDDCRASRQAWLRAENALRAMPAALPSARVDAAIAALGEARRRPVPQRRLSPGRSVVRSAGRAIGGAVAVGLAAAMAVVGGTGVFGPARGPATASQAPGVQVPVVVQGPGRPVLVASAVQQVLNTKTNTLYVLRPDEKQVDAIDPFSRLARAAIAVPAKPITLAVNEDANRVYVIDVLRQLVEIDGDTNTVTSTTPNVVQGTPTAVSYDAGKKQIVVAAETTRAAAAPSAAPSAGVVVVLDSVTKMALQSTTTDAVPQTVVLDDSGSRALLVSSDATTIVDAQTYKPSLKLPGGVAGAFATGRGPVAVISRSSDGTTVTFFGNGAPKAVDLKGSPVAITPTPDGGFGVLTSAATGDAVYVIDAAGRAVDRLGVAAGGTAIVYDQAAKRLAVLGADVTYASLPAATPTGSAAPSGSPSLSASASPQPSASPRPSAPAAVVAKPSRSPLPAPAGAVLAWTGTYRIELPYGKRVEVATIDPLKRRIWFVDQNRTLNAMRTSDYAIFPVAQLPSGANIDALLAGYGHVYAVDRAGVQLYDLTIDTERWTARSIGPLRDGVGFSVTPDDRLWFGRGTQLLSYDPRTRQLSAVEGGVGPITAVTADVGARVWLAGAESIAVYDTRSSRLTRYVLPSHGAASAIGVDGSGALWVSTVSGELFSVADGELRLSARTAAPYTGFVVDASGAAVGIGPVAGGTSVGLVDGSRTRSLVPGATGGVFFDAEGRAWYADRTGGVFFATEGAQ